MTANQMHIHNLINQLAANGYTHSTQNTVDSLWNTHNFHFTHDFFLAKWGRQEDVKETYQLHASYLLKNSLLQQETEYRVYIYIWSPKTDIFYAEYLSGFLNSI